MLFVTETVRLHVRFNGRSEDLDLTALGLSRTSSDAELCTALARHYDCTLADFANSVVIREPQAIIVRPVAFYG